MTKKDYIIVAWAIIWTLNSKAKSVKEFSDNLIGNLVVAFEKDNPKFDEKRFREFIDINKFN